MGKVVWVDVKWQDFTTEIQICDAQMAGRNKAKNPLQQNACHVCFLFGKSTWQRFPKMKPIFGQPRCSMYGLLPSA